MKIIQVHAPVFSYAEKTLASYKNVVSGRKGELIHFHHAKFDKKVTRDKFKA